MTVHFKVGDIVRYKLEVIESRPQMLRRFTSIYGEVITGEVVDLDAFGDGRPAVIVGWGPSKTPQHACDATLIEHAEPRKTDEP